MLAGKYSRGFGENKKKLAGFSPHEYFPLLFVCARNREPT